MARTIPDVSTPGDLGDEINTFLRAMRRANVSPNTQLTYGTACVKFAKWLVANAFPTDMDKITSPHVTDWEISLQDEVSAGTVNNRHRGLQRFFGWYAEQLDENSDWRNPMGRLRPPKVEQVAPRILTVDQMKAVLATCSPGTFEDRRDLALILILATTGLRRREVANLRWHPTDTGDRDVDTARDRIKITWESAKGRKERTVPLEDKAADALQKYIRARKTHIDKHPGLRDVEYLWLGTKGRLTDSGIAQAVRRRGMAAHPQVPALHPHELRHFWRDTADRAGYDREMLMAIGGWTSDAMLRRYAASAANERALEKASKIRIGDKL